MKYVFFAVVACVACAGYAEETVLESAAMRIRFADASRGFAISRIENRLAGGYGFVRAPGNGDGFWSVTFARKDAGTNVFARLSSRDAAEKSVERTPDGGARFHWKNMALPGEARIADVTATVSFDAHGASTWRLEVDNRSMRWALWRTIYPLLYAVMPEGKGDLLMPAKSLGARLIRHYDSHTKTRKRFLHPSCYPSVSAYMVGDAGLYVAAHDDDARIKETVFTVGMNAFFETPVEHAGVVGRAAEGPRYPVVIACFKGDWWEAAKLYREWALKRPCMKGRIVERADFPRSMAETDVWALGGGKPERARHVLATIDRSFQDVAKGLEWTQWQAPAFLAQLPDIFPAVPGVSELMRAYVERGFTFLPYLNGRVWDPANSNWSVAKDKVTVDETGRPHTEKYNDRDYGVMCAGTELWQAKVREVGLRNLNETGANGIYYDQIACSPGYPCYNPDHGHPIGGGTWWTDGYRKALQPVHAAYAAKNAPVTSEQAGDFLPDVIDGYLLATVPLADDVPFFTAVYSGYLVYHGIRMMPGNTDEAFFAAHARQLLWGVTPGWIFSWLLEYPHFASKAAIVVRMANLRHAARDYLAYGSLVGDVKPLDAQASLPFDFNDYASESTGAKMTSTTRAELPAVIGTVWQSADGKGRAVVAANLSASDRTIRFKIPNGAVAFAPRQVKNEPAPYFSMDGDVCTLTLAPHALAFLDGRPGGDPVGYRRTHTVGWENIDGLRKEFPPVKIVWRAADDGFAVTKEDGAEGSVEITNGVVTIRKTNNRGRIVVAARPFAAKGGTVLRFFADVIASSSASSTAAGGRLCAWVGKRKLEPIDRWGLKWFSAGGDHMRKLVNTVPPMTYRKYFHLPMEKDGRASVAIVVDGAASESSWRGLAAEDNAAAQEKWEAYRPTLSARDRAADMCPEDSFRQALQADGDHTAEIVNRNGFSTLLLDGRPMPPIAYKSSGECGNPQRGVVFAGKPVQEYGGVPLAVMSLRLGDLGLPGSHGPWSKSGFKASELADQVEKNMRVGDKMLFILALNTSAYPEFTIEEHPDEVWVKEDGTVARGNSGSVIPDQYNDGGKLDKGDRRWPWVSYASPAWRGAVKRIVGEAFGELRRRGLMKRIVGVHFCGYHDGQFAMPILDYSQCAKAAYADYLKKNHLKDTDPEGTYSYFSSQLGFFALEDFSREAKRLAGKPIIACRWVMSPFNVAFDMGSFVKSDAVDVIINQPDYSKRLPGFSQGVRVPAESFHLHRKLQWCEFDLRTYAGLDFWAHSVIAVKGLNTASDLAMWRNVHRKHAGIMNAHRMGWWYYDMADGWYYPREIASDIGEVYEQCREFAAKTPDPWRPDVAFVIDEVAMSAYGKPGGPKVASRATLCNTQWTKSAQSGVPYDSYLALDFYAKPERAKQYKAIVWSGFNAPDEKQRALMDRVAAWGIPSFVVQPGGFTPEFFNRFARDAGAFVACEPGKIQVDINGDFLSVHCVVPGRYEVRLPFDATVVNMKDGTVAAGDRLHLDLSAGETCWFRLKRRHAQSHEIVLDGPALTVDDGLLLGNGSLSVSCFQSPDGVTFRFGRNDVWDRRIDYAANPPPPTHDEFVRGILDEGWTCRSWTSRGAKATKGTKDERRFLEICQGTPPAMKARAYPCQKPTGDLRLNLPIDFTDYTRWRQRLMIEEGRLLIEASWTNGVRVALEAAVAPDDDVFAVRWKVTGWTDALAPGKGEHRRPPVWCELVRAADTTGLQPPRAFQVDARRAAVEQSFPAETTFPNGFAARLTLAAPSANLGEVRVLTDSSIAGAGVRWLPKAWNCVTGVVFVTARTTSDGVLDASRPKPFADVLRAAAESASRFWQRSAVRIPGDRFLEDLWYTTGHARRCVLGGRGVVPPGLFFPSTVGDAPNWHGDWHANFNYQSMFWGDFTANRLDEAAAYFTGAERFIEAGRIIASKYYGMRGFCVPLQGFPIKPTDDYAGAVPLGRMVYQTGWMVTRYLEYYAYTLDRAWLKNAGYPVVRDAALFYLDFLKKAPSPDLPPDLKDGKYHAFPSIEEETPIAGTQDVLDRPQVLAFIRHTLWAAARMADVLDADQDLRAQWRERLDNLVGAPKGLSPYQGFCHYVNPPEFGFGGQPYREQPAWKGRPRHATHHDSFGHSIRARLSALRQNRFIPERDFCEYRETLERRRRPNGLVRAMVAANWGRYGWTESLSAMAPMQEMMLQSWDGAIRLFPYWPKDRDASFSRFRAQGAFLVSAAWQGGRIGDVEIHSEKGAECLVHGAWRVFDANGGEVRTDVDPYGRLRFATVPNGVYHLLQSPGA